MRTIQEAIIKRTFEVIACWAAYDNGAALIGGAESIEGTCADWEQAGEVEILTIVEQLTRSAWFSSFTRCPPRTGYTSQRGSEQVKRTTYYRHRAKRPVLWL